MDNWTTKKYLRTLGKERKITRRSLRLKFVKRPFFACFIDSKGALTTSSIHSSSVDLAKFQVQGLSKIGNSLNHHCHPSKYFYFTLRSSARRTSPLVMVNVNPSKLFFCKLATIIIPRCKEIIINCAAHQKK